MKLRWISAALLLVIGVLASLAPLSAATILNVNIKNPACSDKRGVPYCHIQAAINAAPSGAVIQVAPGIYPEHLSMPAKALIILGAKGGGTIVDGSSKGRVLYVRLGASLVVSQMNFRHGNSRGADGGGILNQGTLTLIKTNVVTNTSGNADGGGIYNGGILALNQTSVTSNKTGTASGDGGGIFNAGSSMTVVNSTVSGNMTPTGDGGGIYNSLGSLVLTNSTISGNTAGGLGDGGGIYNSLASLVLSNSTISGNKATDGDGGGVFNLSGTVTLNDVTIAKNAAGVGKPNHDGGGIVNTGNGAAVNVANTIIAMNTATQAGADCSGTLNSQGYNLIQQTAGCTLSGDTTGNITGTNPLLGPLALNPPGDTKTLALLAGSPAEETGNPAPPGSGGNACAATDQRGVARSERCDIGAYEFP
jgi:hypothetical protein